MSKLIEQDKDDLQWRIRYESNKDNVCGRCIHWSGDSNDEKSIGQCKLPYPAKKDDITQLDEHFDGKTVRSFSCRTQFEENKNLHFENGTYYFKNLIK